MVRYELGCDSNSSEMCVQQTLQRTMQQAARSHSTLPVSPSLTRRVSSSSLSVAPGTFIFGSPVPYRADEDTDVVVARCQAALQALINKHQPNAPQGRNYMRALSERWAEWRVARPKLIRTIERITPKPIGRYLHRWATGGKKQK